MHHKERTMDMPKPGEFCWHVLATNDLKSTKDFYGEMLGWEFIDHDMGEATYTMIRFGGKEFGSIWKIPADSTYQVPPHWMGYILVEDINEKLEQAKKLGATVKVPVTKADDMGFFCIVADPTGAHVAFWQTKK